MSISIEEFRQLPPDQQQTVLADVKRRAEARVRATIDEIFDRHGLESQLVPQVTFKPAAASIPTRIEVAPPSGDPDIAARNFFKQFPETRSIRIGNTVYERN